MPCNLREAGWPRGDPLRHRTKAKAYHAPVPRAQHTLPSPCVPRLLLTCSRPLGLQRGCTQAHSPSVEIEKGNGLSFCGKIILQLLLGLQLTLIIKLQGSVLSLPSVTPPGAVGVGCELASGLAARGPLSEARDASDFPPTVHIMFLVSHPDWVNSVSQPASSLSEPWFHTLSPLLWVCH